MPNLCVPMKMKLKISQQEVLAPVFLVYTLQTDNNLTHLNEIILKNAFLLVELILQVWSRREPYC
jgi:hypothetical protein